MLNGSEADAPGRACRASCITVITTSDVPLSHPKLSEQRADLTDVNVGMCTQRPKAAAYCTNQWLEESTPQTCLNLARSGLLTEEVPRQSLGQELNPHGPHNRSIAQVAVQAGSQACSSDSRLALNFSFLEAEKAKHTPCKLSSQIAL